MNVNGYPVYYYPQANVRYPQGVPMRVVPMPGNPLGAAAYYPGNPLPPAAQLRVNPLPNLPVKPAAAQPPIVLAEKPTTLSATPLSVQPAAETLPRGIPNPGKGCYISSTVQALLASKTAMAKIKGDLTQKKNEKEAAFNERKEVQKALLALMSAVQQNQGDEEVISKIKELRRIVFENKFLNSDLNTLNMLSQQDAAVLMMLFLEVIDCSYEREIKWWVENYPRPEPMAMPYFLLEVELKKGKNLQQLVDDLFSPTPVVDPENKRRLTIGEVTHGEFDRWTTKESITRASDLLVIQLKRFGNDLKKIADPVPLAENGVIDFARAFNDSQSHLYKLASCVRHSGSPEKGHYTTHALYQNRWLEYDDHRLNADAKVGDEATAQNYLLVFERL